MTPVVVYVPERDYPLTLQPTEVKEVLKVPLSHLLDTGNYKLDTKTYRDHPIHRFYWQENIIWGLTASFLHQFLELVYDFNNLEEVDLQDG